VHTPPWCGVLSTAGNLVFSGTMEGDFFAVDSVSGKLLWRIQTGGAIWANPISYMSEGKQYYCCVRRQQRDRVKRGTIALCGGRR